MSSVSQEKPMINILLCQQRKERLLLTRFHSTFFLHDRHHLSDKASYSTGASQFATKFITINAVEQNSHAKHIESKVNRN